MVGELGGNQAIGDAAHPERGPAAQATTERGDHFHGALGKQHLDGRPERVRKAQCGVHRGRVASGLDGRHQLPAHAGPRREFRLSESTFAPVFAEPVVISRCHRLTIP
jgi:hypothetical protein